MQSEIADPYAVLELSRTASAEDLRRAYRKLSMAWHPDRHAGKPESERIEAERRFKLINSAYVAVGELLRTKGGPSAASAGRAEAAAEQSDARVEAIRSVVASAALRTVPHLPRHTYRRVVAMVEALLLDTIALGDKAFAGGFNRAVREAIEMAGLGYDSQDDALKVLDAAADDLQWRGRGADPQTWQTLLRPLEDARKVPAPAAHHKAPAVSNFRLEDLLRPEPALVASQGALAVLVVLLLLPIMPLDGVLRLLLLLVDIALLGFLTFGPRDS